MKKKFTLLVLLALICLSAHANVPCNGTPTAGTVSATQTTGCGAYSATLSMVGNTTDSGIAYQWQSSVDGISWGNVVGATNATYVASVTVTIYYRDSITCLISGLAAVSPGLQLVNTASAPIIATIPYFQGFENWTASCYSFDRPDSSWVLNPTYGNNSWRRNDQGSDAGWTTTSGGAYTPTSTEGSNSARFHNYGVSSGTTAIMDLHVDLSPAGTKQIAFDCINASSSDLTISLSEDGGNTFTQLGAAATATVWKQQIFSTSSVSPNAVIRLKGVGTPNSSSSGTPDVGVDSFSIALVPSCDGMPVAGTFSNTQTTGCVSYTDVMSVDSPMKSNGILLNNVSYHWQSSSDGVTYTDIPGATGLSYTATITASTFYRFYVVCAASNDTATSVATELIFAPEVINIATLPYTQDFENWTGTCRPYDRPDSNWSLNPVYGNNSWRRDDQGAAAGWTNVNSGSYTPASTQGAHSARFHSYYTVGGIEGDMDLHIDFSTPGIKQITFDYINLNGTDSLKVELSEDGGTTFPTTLTVIHTDGGWQPQVTTTTSVAANAVIRFAAISDYGNSDIGIDNLIIGVITPCSGTPAPGAITAAPASGCSAYTSALSLNVNSSITGITYQWDSSADGITYTAITGATGTSYIAPVTENVYYRVRATCTNSNSSDTAQPVELVLTTPTPVLATLPYFQSFENWFGTCYYYDRPDSSWTLNPVYGDNSWRRDDQGNDAGWIYNNGNGSYLPTSTQGAHSARFHSYYDHAGAEGDMDLHIDLSTPGAKEIAFDYINLDGTDSLKVELSEDGGATFPTTLMTVGADETWHPEITITNSVSSNAVIRFAGIADSGYTDMGVDSISISTLSSCFGMPVAGTFSSTQTMGCVAYSATLSVDTPQYITGISYQWQSSANGTDYTDIPGATGITYTANVSADIYYRFYVVCAIGNDTAISAASELTFAPEVTSTATLPYFQSFENWTGSCTLYDRPDTNWANDSTTGNDSWRREDQGNDANWTNVTAGFYTPAYTDGAHSARFHNSNATGGTIGSLDLHVDLSPAGTKDITFDCINTSSSDLAVFLSEDGGTTFTQLGTATNTTVWAPQTFTTTSVSPAAVIRIAATASPYSIYGNPDIGIDSFGVTILPLCNGMPVAGTLSTTQNSGCIPYMDTLSVDAPIQESGISYHWQSSTDGITFTDIPGATSLTYSVYITASAYYRFYVVCAASNDTATSTATQLAYTPEPVSVASLPYFQGFESWSGGNCYSFDRPDTNWIGNPNYGDGSWRRDDQGYDANWTDIASGAYSPESTEGSYSARFHTYGAADGTEGDLDLHINLSIPGTKTLSFDYYNDDGDDYLYIALSEDGGNTFNTLNTYSSGDVTGVTGWTTQTLTLTSVSPNAIIRFAATSDFGTTDIGIDSLNITPPACDTLTNLTVTDITQTSATATWDALSTAGYEIVVNTSSTDPATAPGTATASYGATGLQSGITYYAHVRDSCGPGLLSAWTTISFTTEACDSLTGLAVNNVSDTGATISWNAVSGTAGYEYVIGIASTTPPTGTGNATTSVTATTLTPNTLYYVFVRDSCGPNNFSVWDTLSFSTLPLGIATVNGDFNIDAYPNPAKDLITVRIYGQMGSNREVSLTDVAGRVITKVPMSTDRADINMSTLAAGIYLIRYQDDAHTRIIKVNKQ